MAHARHPAEALALARLNLDAFSTLNDERGHGLDDTVLVVFAGVLNRGRRNDRAFRLALDDTGAGNAGLELLSQVPVDFIEIDRAVVAQAHSGTARAVLAGILAIAHETGSYVFAEGIETAELLAFVRQVGPRASAPGPGIHGIHGVQGYLLGRPSEVIPAEATSGGQRIAGPAA